MATVTSSKRQQTHTSSTYESNSSVTVGSNIVMSASGTVDGRDVSVDGTKLDAIEASATADQTAAQILTAIKTVDVNGTSGINAGTLDGVQSGSFLRSDAADTATGLLTLNGGINVLSGTGGGKLRIRRNSSSTDGDDITDIHMDDGGIYFDVDNDNDADAASFQFRRKVNGSFTDILRVSNSQLRYSGYDIWHSNNDGAGSGLDADLLDGVQGSLYARKASPVFTGNLTASGDVGIGTTSPTEKLHIRKAQSTSAAVDPFIKLQPSSTTDDTGLTSIFLGTTTASTAYGISLSGWRGSDGRRFAIKTHSGTNSGTNRFVVRNNGYIGIGTDSPSSKLQVVGTITATTKNFLIDNPRTGGRLQYSVVESNEHGVCVRGESDQEEIQLPEEWEWLVRENSVTVQLTSIDQAKDLFVLERNNVRVKIGGLAVDGKYSYVIYGTRKDVDPLEVHI